MHIIEYKLNVYILGAELLWFNYMWNRITASGFYKYYRFNSINVQQSFCEHYTE